MNILLQFYEKHQQLLYVVSLDFERNKQHKLRMMTICCSIPSCVISTE